MKKCNNCGVQVDDQAKFCQSCGSSDLSAADANNELSARQSDEWVSDPAATEVFDYQVPNADPNGESQDGNGNILAGVVGAFLFSIIGGVLYFVIYQIGVIAGIIGLVTFVLANYGYGLLARTKNKASVAGLISAIVATLVMIFLSEYFCLSYEIFKIYKDEGITIFDAVIATPQFLPDPKVLKAVLGDLAFAYIFGFFACIGTIVNLVKSRKKKA